MSSGKFPNASLPRYCWPVLSCASLVRNIFPCRCVFWVLSGFVLSSLLLWTTCRDTLSGSPSCLSCGISCRPSLSSPSFSPTPANSPLRSSFMEQCWHSSPASVSFSLIFSRTCCWGLLTVGPMLASSAILSPLALISMAHNSQTFDFNLYL